jgi:hypothetical protein
MMTTKNESLAEQRRLYWEHRAGGAGVLAASQAAGFSVSTAHQTDDDDDDEE